VRREDTDVPFANCMTLRGIPPRGPAGANIATIPIVGGARPDRTGAIAASPRRRRHRPVETNQVTKAATDGRRSALSRSSGFGGWGLTPP